MKLIALEEHAFPRSVIDAAGLDLGRRAARFVDDLDDLDGHRLKIMDAHGIDMQVLSAGVGGVLQALPADEAVRHCRALNDALTAATSRHPDRYRAFATLPMSDPVAAAREFERAVRDDGHVGAMIHGQTNGTFLDDTSVEPVLAAAEVLGVPIYLHPSLPPKTVQTAYFGDLDPDLGAVLAGSGWGWHAECGMHVLRMATTGVFTRHPDLQLIVGHMGENLPFSLARADTMIGPVLGWRPGQLANTVTSHVHITTCGYTTTPPLLCTVQVFGADRMLFSVDYPFSDTGPAVEFLRDAPISEPDRNKIAYANAARLLRLS
ncbi:amidohydrolase family protein [Amycolatopsis ultiminotia]|uniref:Amidohydrolase family protein n=1 Tax=Amycolatopsis ultiminotia TaxID=543629 RepID=A0ABP6WHM9_9PSEU